MEKRQIQNKEYTNLITVGLINTDGIILSNKNNIKLWHYNKGMIVKENHET